jgi:hypothetical protein
MSSGGNGCFVQLRGVEVAVLAQICSMATDLPVAVKNFTKFALFLSHTLKRAYRQPFQSAGGVHEEVIASYLMHENLASIESSF